MRKITFEQYKEELKNSFKLINEDFETKGIFWWGNSGTVLGAARDKGMIPWDDDIDMTMFNDEYIKNIDKINEICSKHNFELFDPITTNALDVARLFSKEYILVEWEGETFMTKIFIDIMLCLPIKKESKLRSLWWVTVNQYSVIYRRFYRIMPRRAIIKNKMKKLGFFTNLGVFLGKVITFLFMFWIPIYQKKMLKRKQMVGEKYQMFTGANTWGTYFTKAEENFVKVKYDDTSIYINSDYETTLKNKYGDWHKLPKEEERIPKHFPITIYTGKEQYEIAPYIII